MNYIESVDSFDSKDICVVRSCDENQSTTKDYKNEIFNGKSAIVTTNMIKRHQQRRQRNYVVLRIKEIKVRSDEVINIIRDIPDKEITAQGTKKNMSAKKLCNFQGSDKELI